jgi:hypothetical protein
MFSGRYTVRCKPEYIEDSRLSESFFLEVDSAEARIYS